MAFEKFTGKLDAEPSGKFAPFSGELDEPNAPAASGIISKKMDDAQPASSDPMGSGFDETTAAADATKKTEFVPKEVRSFVKGFANSDKPLVSPGRLVDGFTAIAAQQRKDKLEASVLDKAEPVTGYDEATLNALSAKPQIDAQREAAIKSANQQSIGPRTDTITSSGGILQAAANVPGNLARTATSSLVKALEIAPDILPAIYPAQTAERLRAAASGLDKSSGAADLSISDKPLFKTGNSNFDALIPSARDVSHYVPEGLKQLGQVALMGGKGIIADAGVQGYDKSRSDGLSPGMSLFAGAGQALTEGVPEALAGKFAFHALDKVPMRALLSGDAKALTSAVQRSAMAMGVELGSEELSSLGNWYADKIFADPTATPQRLKQDLIDAFKATLIQGPSMIAGGKLVQSMANALPTRDRQQLFQKPAADPIAEINKAQTVDQAVAAMNEAVNTSGNSIQEQAPTRQAGVLNELAPHADDVAGTEQRISDLQAANAAIQQTQVSPGEQRAQSLKGDLKSIDELLNDTGESKAAPNVEAPINQTPAEAKPANQPTFEKPVGDIDTKAVAAKPANLDDTTTSDSFNALPASAQQAIGEHHMMKVTNQKVHPGLINAAWEKATVPVESLRDKNAEHFEPGKQEEYAARKIYNTGPSVLDRTGELIDGNHRFNKAVRDGQKTIEVYRPIDQSKESAAQEIPAQADPENIAPSPTKDLADARAGLADLERTRKKTRTKDRADIDSQIERAKAAIEEMESAADTTPASDVRLGRDNVPLHRGGKPYKTNRDAKKAQSNQPVMRVMRVEGGFALAQKTEKQLAAEVAAARRLRNPRMGLPGQAIAAHEFIAGKGMLSPNERADMGMEGNVRIGNRFLFASAGNGLTMAQATEYLYEEGYIQEEDEQAARNLIKRSLTNPQYTPEGVERMAGLEAEQQRKNFDAEQEAIALAQEAEDNAYDAAVAASDAAMSEIDVQSPYTDLKIEEALLLAGYTEQEVTNERNETGEVQTPAGNPDAGAAGAIAQADQSPAEVAASEGSKSDSGRESAPGSDSRSGSEDSEKLSLPTEADALKMGLGDFTSQAEKLVGMPGGSWILLDGRRASYENGQFNVAFSWGNGKWSAGSTHATPAETYRDALKSWISRGNKAEDFKPADKNAFLSGTQGPDLLSNPNRQDILDQQQRKQDADKAEAKAKADADKKEKADRDAADIKIAGANASDRFVLGGNAEDELSGQGGMFGAPAADSKAPAKDNGQNDWTVLGKNKDGKTLVQDKRGVRSYVENGIRIEEPVMMRPTRNGMQFSTEHKGEFVTADEMADGENPPALLDPLSEQAKAAKAKMLGAAAKLAELLSKNTRANITPEQELAMLPIVIELFDGAMELGYVKFKQAARYVREFLASTINQDAADSIPMDTLQGAYIATARRHKDKAITPKSEVITVDSFDELNEPVNAAENSLLQELFNAIKNRDMPKDNPALRKLVEGSDGKTPSPSRMKQAQELLETAIVMTSREVVAKNEGDQTTYAQLESLYNSQPNLNIRTSTSIANQAYSTPAPLAFLASRLAGITGTSKVFEPTAGNGMLAIGANIANTTTNELNDDRVASLTNQGFTPTQRDATEGFEGLPPQDAVVTNPPFGSVKDANGKPIKVQVDGFNIGQIDHLIAARALATLKDDGKAVLILGANKVEGGLSTDDRIFFNWLYSHYNVVGHFEVDGSLYMRQGASWPVRVIAINGRQKSNSYSPIAGTIKRAQNWSEVYEQYKIVLDASRQPIRSPGTSPVGDGVSQAGTGSLFNDAGDKAPGTRKPGARGSKSSAGNVPGTSTGAVSNSTGPAAGSVGTGADEQRLNAQSDGPRGLEPSGKTDTRTTSDKPAKPAGTAALTSASNAFQVPYIPRSARKDEGVLIPTNMARPTQDALNALEDDVGDIDEFARKELGYTSVEDLHAALMGLQVDSVAMAIYQIKKDKAVVIADQTGIGKGRQAAAIIRWAVKSGYTPIFISVKPSLFTDMYGDLADIGTDDVRPFVMNTDAWVAGADGEKLFANKASAHRARLSGIEATATLPDDRNAVFMTYSQINVDNVQRRALMALAPNAVFILDESHNAAGTSATGEFVIGALGLAKGVTYLSATYAKRPDNMPLYFKTDIGNAAADTDGLALAMSAGGLPLQTVVSNNLVKAGQMFRRERSYDGVQIASVFDKANRDKHEKISDEATRALRAVVSADKAFHSGYVKNLSKEMEKQGESLKDSAGNQVSAGVQHTEFSSVVHNFVKQMLLGLKAQSAADEAIASLKRGEKPIIAVENTMGSFLAEYAASNNIAQGYALGSFDYRTVLSRALERSRVIVIKDAQGNERKEKVPLSMLDYETREAYKKSKAVIDSLKLDIPVSPIDWMRSQIIKAGYQVAEITGRNLSVDYTDPSKPTLSAIDQLEQSDKVNTTRQFNSGKLDALILNVAGSTGISLHASEKFDDQRQRHMIVAQAAGDINIFMQMLGRIHRTGQVALPKYTILSVDLPTEKRPTAVLSIKMKSLNANTSSNTESATSVKTADILNKYGDQVVAEYLGENYNLAVALDVQDLIGGDRVEDDLARKVTGRLALQPIEVQHAFYDEVEGQYNGLIDYLNKTNQNDLEPRTFDFDAKELRQEVLFEGPDKSTPFGEDAIYGEYSIKAQGIAMKPEEIREAIKTSLDGKTPEAQITDTVDTLLKTWVSQINENRRKNGLVPGAFDEDKYASFIAGLYGKDSVQSFVDAAKAQIARGNTVEDIGTDQIARSNDARIGIGFMRAHAIGKTFRVDINGEAYNAIVTNIRSTHKETGNPFSLSKIQLTVSLNGALRSLSIPASQFNKIEVSSIAAGFQVEQLFKEQPPNQRETAKIVTGNLLAAYGEIAGARGTIISFTKQDGTTEQGILLPKLFDYGKNTHGDFRLPTGEMALRFLQESNHRDIGRFGIMSRDGNVRVLPSGQGIRVQVPKSRAKGGKFFLDKALIDAGGDFVSSGNYMVSTVYDKQPAISMLDLLMKKQALYALPSMADEAKQMTGSDSDAPKFSRVAASAGAQAQANDVVQKQVDSIKASWKNAPQIVVAFDMQDAKIPQRIRDEDLKQRSGGAVGTPEGFYYKGVVYLMSSQLKTIDDTVRVLFHESLGHAGLRGNFGKALNPILQQIILSRPDEIAAKIKEYGLRGVNQIDRMTAAEEVLAELAQTRPELGIVKRAIAAIRTWLRANVPGFKTMALSDADIIANYILPARNWVERGQQADVSGMVPAFSRSSTDQTDTPAFKKWFGDSRVVDAQGKPLVVYHGTARDIKKFTPKSGSGTKAIYGGRVGSWFTGAPITASVFARKKGQIYGGEMVGSSADATYSGAVVYPVFLSLKNPKTYTDYYQFEEDLEDEGNGKYLQMRLKEEGFDGIVIEESMTDTNELRSDYVVFDSSQIKSAIGNNGNYDASNPDIRFSRSTPVSTDQTPAEERKAYTGPGANMMRGAREFGDVLYRDLMMKVAPMSAGEQKPRAAAQTFANDVRVARFQWEKMTTMLKDKLDPEQRKAMWEAAEEENAERIQQRDDENYVRPEGTGIDALPENQRKIMQTLNAYGNQLWRHAQAAGLVQGDGVPFWSPRMAVMIGDDGDFAKPGMEGKKTASDGSGRNVFTTAPSAKHRKYDTLAESEKALKAKLGEDAQYVRDILTMPLAMSRFEQAIAGRELINQVKEIGLATGRDLVSTIGGPNFFTLDHPAFTNWRPRMMPDASGKVVPVLDENGEIVMDRQPLFIDKSFEGPLKAVMSTRDGTIYSGYMLLKSKAISVLLASPLTHNMVIYGRALAYNPAKVGSGYLYWKGHIMAKDSELMTKLIGAGMVPIGANRNSMMDITDVARGIGREGGWGDSNESWVNLSLQKLGNALKDGAGDTIKSKADKLGDFVHHTLLWKQVGAIQVGIANDMLQHLMSKGYSEKAALTLAAHFSNRYAGAVASENMSEIARKAANVLLFSRSFNMGNLGAMKDVFAGMPSGMKAKLLEDVGEIEGKRAIAYARRKAISSLVVEVGFAVIALSMVQSAVDRWDKDKDLSDIEEGYVRRMRGILGDIKEHPFNPKSYNPYKISPTWDNEPGRQDRINMGPQANGRYEYMRLPTGKVVEDMIGWATEFGATFSKKMSPMAKAMWQDLQNDKGFGVPVADPEGSVWDKTYDMASHIVKAQVPWDSLKNMYDLTQGKASDLDKDKMIGFLTGFSYSQGHPQGPEEGVASKVEERVKASKMYAMEEIKDLIKYGKDDEARERLEKIGLTVLEINHIMNTITDPKTGMSRAQNKKFNQHSTDEEKARLDGVAQ